MPIFARLKRDKMMRRFSIMVVLLTLTSVTSMARANGWVDRLLEQLRVAFTEGPIEAPSGQQIEVAFSPDGGSEALVLKVIRSAKSSIRLAGYVFTSPTIARALIKAKQHGVAVAVLVDNKGNLAGNRSHVSRQALNLLVNAGIPTRTIGVYSIHHDKYIVVDKLHVETGSFNYSVAAAKRNSENVLVVWHNDKLASRYIDHWQSRWQQGRDYRSSY